MLPFPLPPRLGWLRDEESGRRWLAGLPETVAACVDRWSLRVGMPYQDSLVSLVLPATRADGSPAVLKLQFPDRESEHEATALRRWAGHGAIRLLDEDRPRRALLLEACRPGTPLSTLDLDAALDVYAGLLPRLWVPAGKPFGSLAEEANGWADRLPDHWEQAGRPFERRLVDAAVELLRGLAG
ncbi:MAG TPA: aminoglycoside phosphotransferase family protein, partial [Micromonospora sp.]